MSIRSELRTLIRLAPEATTGLISNVNLNLLLDKASIATAVRGRALPKNEKVNSVASQQEYVVSGASSVLTDDDFGAIDLRGGGVLFYNGSRWIGSSKEGHGDGEFEPKTWEWLDKNYTGWRSNAAASFPLYWYLNYGQDASSNLVVGLVDKPSASTADAIWIHYLGRGKLMTDDTHYPWTGSTTQLKHLEQYEMLLVFWCLEYIQRIILHNPAEANNYLQLFEAGADAMATRMPLVEHLAREGMRAITPFTTMGYGIGGGRY